MDGTMTHTLIDRHSPLRRLSRGALAGLLCATLSGCAMLTRSHRANVGADSLSYSRAQAETATDDAGTAPGARKASPTASKARARRKASGRSEPLKDAVETETSAEPREARIEDVQELVTGISNRVDAIEGKLTTIDEKLDTTRASIDALAHAQTAHAAQAEFGGRHAASTVAVTGHPAESGGTSVSEPAAESDPEAGFANDGAIREYRRALITYGARNYPESVLAFSSFLEKHPDHALAGSAQYYVGEAYFKQKEYKLAAQEFGRVLARYSRSPRIAETLRDLAESEDRLRQNDSAARHRQLLSSLFPASPAATRVASLAIRGEDRAEAPAAPRGNSPASTRAPVSTAPRGPSSPLAEALRTETADEDSARAASRANAVAEAAPARKPDSLAQSGPVGLDPMPTGMMTPPTAPIADPADLRSPAGVVSVSVPANSSPPTRATSPQVSVPSATGRSEIHPATEGDTETRERPTSMGELDPTPGELNEADFTNFDGKAERR